MNDVVMKEFLREHRLIGARMTEQIESGTITIEDGCVRLTSRGRIIVKFTRFYRKTLLPKRRVLMGEVTSDLTDPFKDSESAGDYRCQVRQRELGDPRE